MTGIDPDRFRKHAEECHEQAVRNMIDKEAWLRLAEDLIKIAEGLEKLHRENKTCDPCNNVDEQIGDNKGTTMADEHQTNAFGRERRRATKAGSRSVVVTAVDHDSALSDDLR